MLRRSRRGPLRGPLVISAKPDQLPLGFAQYELLRGEIDQYTLSGDALDDALRDLPDGLTLTVEGRFDQDGGSRLSRWGNSVPLAVPPTNAGELARTLHRQVKAFIDGKKTARGDGTPQEIYVTRITLGGAPAPRKRTRTRREIIQRRGKPLTVYRDKRGRFTKKPTRAKRQ